MTSQVRRWFGAGSTMITFMVTAWILGAVLDLGGVSLWVLRIGFSLLGVAAAFLVYKLTSDSGEKEKEGEASGDRRKLDEEIDEIFSETERRLSAAGVEPAETEKRPIVLLLGPHQGTKTSLVEEGGLDAELLAGEVRRGNQVVPTEAANVWLAGETLFVEAGGDLLDRDDGWSRLAGHLRPSRLAAVLGRGQQPSRTAVVCFPCDELLAAEDPDAVAAEARSIRARLRSLAGKLGIRLPVYTIFTKLDRLPHFRDFVENFDPAEVQEVLGATLPPPDDDQEGAWSDRQAERVGRHFDGVFHGLARKRTELLARSGEGASRGAIYEFPREFQKMRDRTVRFLVELCKPTRLAGSPLLRGFYFTGVRPVVAEQERGAAGARPMEAVGEEEAASATMAFDAREARRPSPTADPGGGSRRVPQWVFVKNLFRQLFLGDPVARAITAGGSRINLLRRALAGSALALGLIFFLGVQVSFFRNEGRQDEVRDAIERAETLGAAETGRVTLPELQRLDTLGRHLYQLRTWEVDGPPLSFRWGLYSGDDLLPPARRVFFDRFDPELGRAARQRLTAYLRPLPDSPSGNDSSYGDAYTTFKAYLILTSNPEQSSEEFLVPVLMEHWQRSADPGPEMRELARRQFAVYARELKFGNPFDVSGDGELIARVRDYLRQFTEVERFYKSMIARASQEASAVRFSEALPAAGEVIDASHTVPGAFTRQGWEFVQHNLDNVDSLLAREEWVTGEQAFSEAKLAELSEELENRYVSDYVSHWRRFIASVRLANYSNVDRAAGSLTDLSGNRSPILQLLALVDEHTSVDSARVGYAFQPVRAVAPPDSVDRFVVESNRSYIQDLGALQGSMEQVADLSGVARKQARGDALRAAQAVEGRARKIGQDFSIEGEAQSVGNAVQELLELPGARAGRLLERLPVAEANQRARQFCRQFEQLASQFPFSTRSSQSAGLEELGAVFKPDEGALWGLWNQVLSDLMVRAGSGYRPRPGAAAQPTQAAVDFFNQAAAISRSLYGGDGSVATVDFILKLEASEDLPEVSFAVDGQKQTFTRTMSELQRFTWNGPRAQYARITAGSGPDQRTLVDAPNGTWALFRLFRAAEWESRAGGRFRLEWEVPSHQTSVQGELLLDTPAPIFDAAYLGDVQCPSRVAR